MSGAARRRVPETRLLLWRGVYSAAAASYLQRIRAAAYAGEPINSIREPLFGADNLESHQYLGRKQFACTLESRQYMGKSVWHHPKSRQFFGGRHVDDGPELGGSSLAVVLHPVGTGRKNCGWSSPGGLLGSSAGLLVNPEGLFAPIQYILWAQGTYIYIYP